MPELVLENEANISLNWLERKEMTANLKKFHALSVRKDQEKASGRNISFQGHAIKFDETVPGVPKKR